MIITGESARKENSEIVLRELSDFAGEFVVSTAGPDLEAIIAGKGSGARQYSIDNQCTVANLDIGGGTTNVVLFDSGEVIAKGCVDIGGRLVKVTSDGRVEYISDSVLKMIETDGLSLNIGDEAQYTKIYRIGEIMADLLYRWLCREDDRLLAAITTPGSSEFKFNKPIRAICFSGRCGRLYLSSGRGILDAVWQIGRCAWRDHPGQPLVF